MGESFGSIAKRLVKEERLSKIDNGEYKTIDLLVKLYSAAEKLDMNYCTTINEDDLTIGMSGEEYEEISNLLLEIKDYLEQRGLLK